MKYGDQTRCLIPVFLYPANNSAGDLFSCISSGLSSKVIGISVNHNGSTYDIIYPEASRQHRHFGSAAMGQKGRQIPGMVGMGLPCWIKMTAGVLKIRSGAASALMDVEGIKPIPWKTGHLCGYQNAAALLQKTDTPFQPGVLPASRYAGSCPGQSAWLHVHHLPTAYASAREKV